MTTPLMTPHHSRRHRTSPGAPTDDPRAPDEPLPEAVGSLRLVPVGDRLWRIVGATGVVVGHLRVDGVGARRRFVARRFHLRDNVFRDVGAFWTLPEALDCLRLSR